MISVFGWPDPNMGFDQSEHALYSCYFIKAIYTAKNAQIATNLLTSWNNLLQQADIRMCSHGLRQLVDDKSVANCRRTCCKLIVQPCYEHAGLLQVV